MFRNTMHVTAILLFFAVFSTAFLSACASSRATEYSSPAAAPLRVYVEPFTMHDGTPEFAWIATSFRGVMHREWGDRRLFVDQASGADRSIIGEYWIKENRLIVAAAVHHGMRVSARRQWEAPADREDLVLALLQTAARDLEKDLAR